MQEFFDDFGMNNLVIILAVIGAIILALIIIVIIEKIDNKRRNKDDYDVDLGFESEPIDNFNDNEIVYVEDAPTIEEAKHTLEDVQKKLVENELKDSNEDTLIGHTHFELEQEEKSIISYEELKNASLNVDETNDKLLDDEGSEPITIDELYKIHLENNNSDELDNPVYDEEMSSSDIDDIINSKIGTESFSDDNIASNNKVELKNTNNVDDNKKFRNSEVISPVFGIYKQEQEAFRRVAPANTKVVTDNNNNNKYEKKNLDDIEFEIEKTQEFLEELKILRSKLK